MSPIQFVATALLLGAFVTFGGLYAGLLSVGHVMHDARWGRAAKASFVIQCILVLIIVAFTPLLFWWKLLIAVSAVAYYFIPPMTWRYLTHLHRPSEEVTS